MPQDEDWMPMNGNPHPMPSVPFPEMPPFILPPFPALGWNDVPPPPPEPAHNEVDEDNWGNWEEPGVEDQESVVLNGSAQPSSAHQSSEAQPQVPPAPIVLIDGAPPANLNDRMAAPDLEDANNWAIVVYQPPPFDVRTLEQPVVLIPFGPPLPPEMIWRRSFENLLNAPMVFEVPKPLLPKPLSPVILNKRTWDFAFQQDALPLLTWKESVPARPVARALFVDEGDRVVPVVPSPPERAPTRRPRKVLAPTPLVETSVRRCTRSSAQRDGFKPTFHELVLQPKKKPKAKPLSAEMSEDPAFGDVPPPTPISHLQAIGKELEIDATLLTEDALMVDPSTTTNQDSNE
nr:WAS/WASL-interacting protein family member 1-like [Aegilops tauschii subsp. strangulata]